MAIRILPAFLSATLLLGACGDRGGDYPPLTPTDQLLAEPSIPGHATIAAGAPDQVMSDLEAAGADLAVSSARIRAEDDVDSAELSRRARALQRRAEEISRESICDSLNPPESCE